MKLILLLFLCFLYNQIIVLDHVLFVLQLKESYIRNNSPNAVRGRLRHKCHIARRLPITDFNYLDRGSGYVSIYEAADMPHKSAFAYIFKSIEDVQFDLKISEII